MAENDKKDNGTNPTKEKRTNKTLVERVADMLQNKRKLNRLLMFLFALIELTIISLMALTVFRYLFEIGGGEPHDTISISHLVAVELILLWMGILVGYLGWSIYFYNINFGLTNQDWFEIREDPNSSGPSVNPHHEETLGLPKGTVRGAIALTVMVGGLAMTIYSFGLGSDFSSNSFVVDHLDFFKTAFLMVIAFYFGNKSLETIGYKSSGAHRHNASDINSEEGSNENNG